MAFKTHFEPLAGTVDGVNTTFTASTAFVDGSEVLFVRGLPRRKDWDDGWVVVDASLGTIQLNEPPELDDDVQMLWLEVVPDTPGEEITEISCHVADLGEVSASIAPNGDLTGTVLSVMGVVSGIDGIDGVACNINDMDAIIGEIKEC